MFLSPCSGHKSAKIRRRGKGRALACAGGRGAKGGVAEQRLRGGPRREEALGVHTPEGVVGGEGIIVTIVAIATIATIATIVTIAIIATIVTIVAIATIATIVTIVTIVAQKKTIPGERRGVRGQQQQQKQQQQQQQKQQQQQRQTATAAAEASNNISSNQQQGGWAYQHIIYIYKYIYF